MELDLRNVVPIQFCFIGETLSVNISLSIPLRHNCCVWRRAALVAMPNYLIYIVIAVSMLQPPNLSA